MVICIFNDNEVYTELNYFNLDILMELCSHEHFKNGTISVTERSSDLNTPIKSWEVKDLTPMIIMKEIGRYFMAK